MSEKIVPLIEAANIAKRVRELGAEIARDYDGRNLVLVCILKGSFMFTADLSRAIGFSKMRIEFLGVRSYGEDTISSGVVQITQDLPGFWRDQYPRVKQELQRKYPKHQWR